MASKKVSKLWWWNRFKAWFHHWNYDYECEKTQSGMCPYCKSEFEKWLKKEDSKNG